MPWSKPQTISTPWDSDGIPMESLRFPWDSDGILMESFPQIPMARYKSGFSGAKALHNKRWPRRGCAVSDAMILDAHRLP